jgi:Cys-tRNA(Pro)/Cys-tRNA(Cys) deacylase
MAGEVEHEAADHPSTRRSGTAHVRLVARLERSGARFAIHEHAAAPTVAEAQARLPFPLDRFLKTVAFRLGGRDAGAPGPDGTAGAGWVLVALRGVDRVDFRKLADALGVRRGDLARPSPDEIRAELGLPFGGVGPIPPIDGIRVLFDAAALDLGTVYCGVGSDTRTLEIDVRDLVAVSGGAAASVAQ